MLFVIPWPGEGEDLAEQAAEIEGDLEVLLTVLACVYSRVYKTQPQMVSAFILNSYVLSGIALSGT